MSEYPEHDRMLAVKDKSQVIGEFLEWLTCDGVVLAKYEGGRLWPAHMTIEFLLASYFDIDLKKIEAEKRAMLASIRGGQS